MDQKRDIRLVKQPDSNLQPYYSQSWALVIGIDRYRDASARLANARNDAAAVADVLAKAYNFEHVYALYDEEATKDVILSWLRDKLPAEIERNDRLVIFFAGHGTTRESSSGQKRGYLIPYEAEFGRFADYVDMSELRDACGWIPAKHILIILDCCFSGVAAVTTRTTPTPSPVTKLTENYVRRMTERSAWQVLTAGAQDELVADSGSHPGHSAFTSALLAGLRGDADHNQDGVITASDLANFVKPEVSRETTAAGGKGQIPFFSYFAGSDQGDFVLIKPGETLQLAAPPLHEAIQERVMPRSNPLWTFGIPALAVLILAVMGWFVWYQTQQMRTELAALVGTATQGAIAFSTQQQATLEAVADAPEATQTAIVAAQTAAVASTETAVAALWTSIAEGVTPSPAATITQTPPATAPPASQQEPAAQSVATPATPTSQTAVSQSDIPASNSLINPQDCAEFVHIPTGEFEMGPDNLSQSQIEERYTIFVDDFWIGRTEVTNSQYRRCLQDGDCSPTGNERLNDSAFDDHPVVHVTWEQAMQYASWAGGRLPTEAEWEKAACGNKGTLFPWGDQDPDETLLLNVNSDNTMPVGSFPAGANPFELLDMAGNVQEWTSSLAEDYPYQGDDGRENPNATGLRITRGGSFYIDPSYARCSARVAIAPDVPDIDIGFRIVVDDPSVLVDSDQCDSQ